MNKEETTKYIPEESESKINVDFDALRNATDCEACPKCRRKKFIMS